MAKSTGPVLAIGAITVFNDVILNHEELDLRVPVATAFAAMVFSLLEKANEPITVGVAWIALLTVLLARVDPKKPSPVESLLASWNKGR